MQLAPGLHVSKIIAVHLNYESRASERGRRPEVPSYFLKPPSSIALDGDALVQPAGTELLQFEGEIALVIGRRARNVDPHDAATHIGWLAAANDIGLHDLRWADRGSNLLSKGQDGFTPLGPLIACPTDRPTVTLTTTVNGETRQRADTDELLFDFGDLVADLARMITLEPGDVILTGTPTGTGVVGPGDEVVVELATSDGDISRVRTPIVAGPPLASYGAQPRATAEAHAYVGGDAAGAATTALSAAAEAALREVATATLTVQLSRRGIRNGFIRGLRPTRPGTRLFGYARTLRYVALREDVRDADAGELNQQKLAVESIEPGEVLVMEARGDAGAGTIGDILAARVLARGGTGIVSDGGLRDSEAVAALDIPTYYQAPHAAVLGLIHYPLETNVPITCGGALVLPGDVIVGDGDGVIVLPRRLAEEIALDALAQEQRELFALERVQAGESIRGIYPLTPERTADYERWRTENGLDDPHPAPKGDGS